MQNIDLQKTENWLIAKDGRRYIPLGESTASRLSSLAVGRIKGHRGINA